MLISKLPDQFVIAWISMTLALQSDSEHICQKKTTCK